MTKKELEQKLADVRRAFIEVACGPLGDPTPDGGVANLDPIRDALGVTEEEMDEAHARLWKTGK